MKSFLIKLLFRLLDREITVLEDKKISQWLAQNYQDGRFHDYISHRDLRILKGFGNGLSREDYLINLGRRLELLSLLNSVTRAYKQKGRKINNKK